MNNHPFEQKLKTSWETIPTPPLTAYRKMITDVTHASLYRNTAEGVPHNQPSYYFHMKKYLIGIGTVVAAIALMVIIPKTHTPSTVLEPTLTTEPQTYGINLPVSTSDSVIDQVVRDILIEASLDADNALSDVSIDDLDDTELFQELSNSLLM